MAPTYFNRGEIAGGASFDEKSLSDVEEELVFNYQESLKKIKADMLKLFDAYGDGNGMLTYSAALQYGRLDGLYTAIGKEIESLTQKNDILMQGSTADVLQSSYDENGADIQSALNRGLGENINLQFGGLNTKAVEAIVKNPLYTTAIEDNASTALVELKREIAQGIINGESYFKISNRIQDRIGIAANKALTIARTEAGKAYSEGQVKAHEEAEELGVVMHKVWVSTLDMRTRDSHQHMDQQVADDEGFFKLPGGYKVKAPRLGGPAKEVVNCRCRMINVVDGYEPATRIARKDGGNEQVDYQTFDEWNSPEANYADAANKIRSLKHEEAYIFDDTGKSILYKTGSTSEVSFTRAECVSIQGSPLMLHNHPGSSSFSPEDITFAFRNSIKEMRVVSKEYDYSFKQIDNGIQFDPSNLALLQKTRRKIHDQVKNEFIDKIDKGEISLEFANKNHYHEVWTRVSKKIGAFYERKEN